MFSSFGAETQMKYLTEIINLVQNDKTYLLFITFLVTFQYVYNNNCIKLYNICI
jgi:hypothetical protein